MEQLAFQFDKQEPHILSVSDLNLSIKNILEGEFTSLWVKGEISNFKAHSSGHFYFSLKDQKSQIKAVMFRGQNSQLKFRPEDGMEVLIRSRISVYEPRGDYQILCEVMEPLGAGALQLAFEQLKKKLSDEGLFDPSKKRTLPPLPKHIAIVTSPTGAAIRDMIQILNRRFRGVQITLIPTRVQGHTAPTEIVEALSKIKYLNEIDVVIVGRGGGSIEDLWAFNDEGVARAIASCPKPIISAVGHEVDFTIADFVADLRAPTPSAAAELVVKSAIDLQEKIKRYQRSLILSISRYFDLTKKHLEGLTNLLIDPQERIQTSILRCDELSERIQKNIERLLGDLKKKILHLGERLNSLSPLKVLDRGYSITTHHNEIIKSSDQISVDSELQLRFSKGGALVKVMKIENGEF